MEQKSTGETGATEGAENIRRVGDWSEHYTDDHAVPYYYNHLTGESVWEPPAEFLASVPPEPHHLNVPQDECDYEQKLSRRSDAAELEPSPLHTQHGDFNSKIKQLQESLTGNPLFQNPDLSASDVSRNPLLSIQSSSMQDFGCSYEETSTGDQEAEGVELQDMAALSLQAEAMKHVTAMRKFSRAGVDTKKKHPVGEDPFGLKGPGFEWLEDEPCDCPDPCISCCEAVGCSPRCVRFWKGDKTRYVNACQNKACDRCNRCKLFWADFMWGGRNAEEKCKCLKKHPRCRRVCSNRYTRWALLAFAVWLFIYIIYVIWAAFELAKIADSQTKITLLHVPNTCAYNLPFRLEVAIHNPSKFGLQIHSAEASPRYRSPLGSLSFEPLFSTGGDTLPSGFSSLILDTQFHVASSAAVGEVLSLILSDRKNIPITWEYSMKITTDAFWFPITTEISGEQTTYLNQDGTVGVIQDSVFPADEPPPPPDLDEIELVRANATNQSASLYAEGLIVRSAWTVYPSAPGYYIQVPNLYTAIGHNGHEVGGLYLQNFSWAWPSQARIEIDMRTLAAESVAQLQQVTSYITTNTTFVLEVRGGDPDDHPPNQLQYLQAGCMIQEAVSTMPTALMSIIPEPYDPNDCSHPDNLNQPQCITDASSAVSGARNISTQEAVEVVSVVAGDITRPESKSTGTFKANFQAAVAINFKFLLWGEVPSVYIDVFSRAERVGYIGITGKDLPSRYNSSDFNISLVAEQERTIVRRMVNYKSLDDLGLVMKGRSGVNLLSDILGGWTLNVTSSSDTDSGSSNNIGTNATQIAPGVVCKVTSDDTSFALDVYVDLEQGWQPTFEVLVPAIDVSVLRVNLTDQSQSSALSIHSNALLLGPSSPANNYSVSLVVTKPQGYHMGVLVDEFFNDVLVSLRAVRSGIWSTQYCHPSTDGCKLNLDVFSSFVKADLTADEDVVSSADPLAFDDNVETAVQPNEPLTLGPVSISKAALVDWTRHLNPVNHSISLNLSALFEPLVDYNVDLYGTIPAFAISVVVNASEILILRSSSFTLPAAHDPGQEYTYTTAQWRAARPFSSIFTLFTAEEERLMDTYNRYAENLPIDAEINGRRDASDSVLSEVLAGVKFNFTLSDGSGDTQSGGSTSSVSSDSAIEWNLVHILVESSLTALDAKADTMLPSIELPLNVSLGALDLQLDYRPPFDARLPMFTITTTSLQLCKAGCPAPFTARMRSDQPDKGVRLSDWVNRFILGEKLPMRLYGTAGAGSAVNVWFRTEPPPDKQIVDTIASSISGNLVGNNATREQHEADKSNGFTFNEVHLLGSTTSGADVTLPCVFPSFFCPKTSTGLTATPTALGLNVSIAHSLPFPINLTFPDIELDFDCCIFNPLASLKLVGSNYVSNSGWTWFELVMSYNDLPLLQYAVTEVTDGESDFSFRAHGHAAGNLVSSMFQKYEALLTIKANEPSTSTTTSAPADEFEFGYWLDSATANSATFRLHMKFENTLSFPWRMGDVALTLAYTDVDCMSMTMPFNFAEGWNALGASVTLFGQSTVTSRCSGSAIPNKQFCVANELISRVIQSATLTTGTNVSVAGTFTNLYGQTTVMRIDMRLYEEEKQTKRRILEKTELGIIKDFGFNVGSTLGNLFLSLASASFEASLTLDLKNIFNFTLNVQNAELDLDVRDSDGVGDYWYIPGTPMAPTESFQLLKDASITNPSFNLAPEQIKTATIAVDIPYSSLPSIFVRMYDEYYVKNRTCGHIRNGMLTTDLLGLTYTQEFRIDDYSMIGYDDCAGILGCSPTTVALWSYGFTNQMSQFDLNGNAEWSGSQIRLTDGGSEKGSAFRTAREYLLDRWQAHFQFKMSPKSCFFTDCPMGDGIVFVIQNVGHNALGDRCSTTGICHGYKGIGNSVGVAFDAYAINEIAVHVNGDTDNALSRSETVPEFDNDVTHSVIVEYIRYSKRLYISLDGDVQLVVGMDLEDTSKFSWTNGQGFVGFTGSTGITGQARIQVSSFSFQKIKTSVDHSTIEEDGFVRSKAGQDGTFTIDARDTCNLPKYEGEETWTVTLKRVGDSTVYVAASVQDLADGRYTVTYNVPIAGTYQVTGAIGGESAVIGSILVEAA